MSDWDESDSCHGYTSEHSDDGDLPSFPTFSSPSKPKDAASPSVHSPSRLLAASLSAATLSCTPEKKATPTVDLSPQTSYGTDKKALERSRKLARKAEELAQRIKVKSERNEKVESYIRQGGVRALSNEWEETKKREESLSDAADSEGPSIRKSRASSSVNDHASYLPRNPPGQTFFVKPPDFISELYPPGYEEDPANSTAMFTNVEENLLTQQEPAVLKTIICSNMLAMCYVEKACPPTVWQWLFQIMCRSHDQELSNGAFQCLTSLINTSLRRQDTASILLPTVADLTDILIMLGADPSAVSGSLAEPMEDDSVFDVASPIYNLSLLLKYLVTCLKSGLQTCYSLPDTEKLIVLLARLSLDGHVCGEIIQSQVSLCIAALVAAIPADQWAASCVRLVSRITVLSNHHHDKLYLTKLVTGTSQRLRCLQKELCRHCLQQLTSTEYSGQTGVDVIIRSVVQHYLDQQRPETFDDYYYMSSVFSLVSLLMHSSEMVWQTAQEKKEVSLLLGNLSSTRIRDNPDHPERSVVKDLVIRLMLEVKCQKVKSAKQQALFAYAT